MEGFSMFGKKHKEERRLEQNKAEHFCNSAVYGYAKSTKHHQPRLDLHSRLDARLNYNYFKGIN